MIHNNIDIENIVYLLRQLPKETITTSRNIKIANGYFKLRKRKNILKWLRK
jgi:hypothetical protein